MLVNLGKIKNFLFENHNAKQTVLKNAFWLTSGTIVSRVIRAILIIYAARVLGAEGYGVLSYALSLAAFFGIFTDIGLSSLLTRESVKNPEKISAYLSTTFFLKLVMLAVTATIMIFISPYFTEISEVKSIIPIVALLMVFDSLRTFGFSITRAKNKMEWEAGLSIATDFFITSLGLLALVFLPGAKSLAYAYTLGATLGFVLITFVLRSNLRGLVANFDKNLIKPIMTRAWPFAIMGLLGGFMINIDTIIIGAFRNAEELGLYAAAQRPVQLLYLFPSLVATSIFPILSKFVHDNFAEPAKKLVEKSIAAIFAAALPIAAGGIILAGPIISFLFGAGYTGSVFTFRLLLLTIILIFPGTIIGNAIFAYDKHKIFIVSAGIGATTNVVLDLFFIPAYGIAGSAVVTIISQILANGINWVYLKKLNGFSIFPHLVKIVPATVLMGIGTFALLSIGINFIVNILISIAIFMAALYILKEPLIALVKDTLIKQEA